MGHGHLVRITQQGVLHVRAHFRDAHLAQHGKLLATALGPQLFQQVVVDRIRIVRERWRQSAYVPLKENLTRQRVSVQEIKVIPGQRLGFLVRLDVLFVCGIRAPSKLAEAFRPRAQPPLVPQRFRPLKHRVAGKQFIAPQPAQGDGDSGGLGRFAHHIGIGSVTARVVHGFQRRGDILEKCIRSQADFVVVGVKSFSNEARIGTLIKFSFVKRHTEGRDALLGCLFHQADDGARINPAG